MKRLKHWPTFIKVLIVSFFQIIRFIKTVHFVIRDFYHMLRESIGIYKKSTFYLFREKIEGGRRVKELIGVCIECKKEIYCLDGFLDGIISRNGQLICFPCHKKLSSKESSKT
jgi:hypothetical protein